MTDRRSREKTVRGHQVTIGVEIITAVIQRFPHMSRLKPKAIIEIALGNLLLQRGLNATQNVIQVPIAPKEKVAIEKPEIAEVPKKIQIQIVKGEPLEYPVEAEQPHDRKTDRQIQQELEQELALLSDGDSL